MFPLRGRHTCDCAKLVNSEICFPDLIVELVCSYQEVRMLLFFYLLYNGFLTRRVCLKMDKHELGVSSVNFVQSLLQQA